MAYERTKVERETIINFNEEEGSASVFTYNKPLIKKLTALSQERDDIAVEIGDEECATFTVPKKWVKVSPPRQVNYTEEQKKQLAERLKNAREAK